MDAEWLRETQRVSGMYAEMARAHPGYTPQRLGWTTRESQMVRLQAIVDTLRIALPGTISGAVVHDAGCGMCDLLPVLVHRWGVPYRYIGSDLDASALKLARRRFAHDDLVNGTIELLQQDMRSAPDATLTIVSGSFVFYPPELVFESIRDLHRQTSGALAFNLITKSTDPEYVHQYDPSDVLRFCRELGRVVVRTDYLANDMLAVVLPWK